MADEVIRTELLDRHMKEVFDWSGSDIPVRDALRGYFIEKNGRNTVKAESDMLPFLKDSDDKIEAFVDENLKKQHHLEMVILRTVVTHCLTTKGQSLGIVLFL